MENHNGQKKDLLAVEGITASQQELAALPPFWALGKFVEGCGSWIWFYYKYQSKRTRKSDYLAQFVFHEVGDLRAFNDHLEAVVKNCLDETKAFNTLFAEFPAILRKDALPDSPRQIEHAIKRFQQLHTTAQLLSRSAPHCFRVAAKSKSQLLAPFLEAICRDANMILESMSTTYLHRLAGIVREMKDVHQAAINGVVKNYAFSIDANADFSSLEANIKRLGHVLEILEQEAQRQSEEDAHIVAASPPPSATTGIIYAMVNPSMPGLVKIGKTRRSGDERALELSSTGVPTPFIVIYEVSVDDCDAAERRAHDLLAEFRVNGKREFFSVKPARAIDILMSIAQPPVERCG